MTTRKHFSFEMLIHFDDMRYSEHTEIALVQTARLKSRFLFALHSTKLFRFGR